MVEECAGLELAEPLFSLVGFLLGESQVNQLRLFILHDGKFFVMPVQVTEVPLSIVGITGTQTLVVLVIPTAFMLMRFLPSFILWYCKECSRLGRFLRVAFPDFDDGSNKLDKEFRNLK